MGSDVDLIRRLNDEAFVGGDPAAVDELVSDDYVTHDPVPGYPATKESLRRASEIIGTAFSDRRFEHNEHVETVDGRVVTSWALSAVHSGEAFGLPASGERITMRGVEIWRCVDGKITENWGAIDMRELFTKARGRGG